MPPVKMKIKPYRVGGLQFHGSLKNKTEITKTGSYILFENVSLVGETSTTVSDNTREANGFFHLLGKDRGTSTKSDEKTVWKKAKILERASEIGFEISSSGESGNPKSASSTISYVVSFCHTGKRLHLRKLVLEND